MSKKWWVLSSVACGTFMATLDSSIVNIALPTLTKELSTDIYRVKWVVISYLLVITCLILPFGRLSDQLGRKKVFQTGFAIFTLASVFCGFAPDLMWLVLARVLQALGVAMLMANGPAIITATFPAQERGGALGILAMVVSGGLVAGPSIGGILISHVGWRSIFFVNIPVGIAGIALVAKYLVNDLPKPSAGPFDWAGAVLQCLFLFCFILAFDPPNISISGSSPFQVSRWLIVGMTVLFGFIFAKIENSVEAPLLDFSLLKDHTFWMANLAAFMTFVAYSSVTVLMPFFLEEVMHFSPKRAGIFMTAIPLAVFLVAPVSGRLSDRMGTAGLSFFGALIGAIGLFGMGGIFGPGIYDQMTPIEMVVGLATIGVAIGLFQAPNNNAIMGAVPLDKLGVASALLATVRNLGLVTGTGLATGLFTWRMAITKDFVSSLHFTEVFSGCFAVVAMIASFSRRKHEFREEA